jgi:hypothetical protein
MAFMEFTNKEKCFFTGFMILCAGAGFTGGLLNDYPSLDTTAAWQYALVGVGAAIVIFSIYKACACHHQAKISSAYEAMAMGDHPDPLVTEQPTKC